MTTENPVDLFIEHIKKVDEKSKTFYEDCFVVINDPRMIGERYEGGKLDTYLNDIQGHGYAPDEVKKYLIELAQTVDRTERDG
ncbi:hypothetical protein ACFSGI_08940 [Paenibacillus nicotianae]|uniref:Uncharacterized protein n=1 Tax=Paenibacillus nicotianae TaxID=1526551 RepID=A0ABW4UUS9_9BACL